ncbi:MAG: L,D-transpeptidase [Gammaproteobacteria bacterium]|nr:L,D-transpeptidase [Gammaproteobacteria bacterium]
MNHIKISIQDQQLELHKSDQSVQRYPISTAKKGAGELNGSECTPRGQHQIRAMIGSNCPLNTVFVARRPTGEIYNEALAQQYPQRDWILTRILWLSGMEKGKNRLGEVDTMQRFIYIHGCPDDCQLSQPGSHGCIRMHNQDVVALFDQVEPGTPVIVQ